LGLYHLIFIKVFLYLRVWAQRYLILVLMGILHDQSFNDRVHLWSWGFTRDIILMRLAFASPNLFSRLLLNFIWKCTFKALSSSGPFQELATLTSNHKFRLVFGSLPFINFLWFDFLSCFLVCFKYFLLTWQRPLLLLEFWNFLSTSIGRNCQDTGTSWLTLFLSQQYLDFDWKLYNRVGANFSSSELSKTSFQSPLRYFRGR